MEGAEYHIIILQEKNLKAIEVFFVHNIAL